MTKLRIPGPAGLTTACGRQLNNHRSAKAQDSANAVLAADLDAYLTALGERKACRYCGRAAGILPKLIRSQPQNEDGDDSDEE